MSGRSASAPPRTASRWCWSRPISARAWSARRCRNTQRYHTRICRPIGLTEDDCARVCTYAAERIGFDYDVKNIFDLLRYLFPLPVPQRWRRRMMALGSGHPTRIICSALIAQAFEHVRYPILPKVTRLESETARRDILEIRHSSLYAPRDFDISPYFALVKPTIERGFDYRRMAWAHLPHTHERCRPCRRGLTPTKLAPPSRVGCRALGRRTRTGTCSIDGSGHTSARFAEEPMFDAAIKALTQMFSPPFRRVLLKSIGLGLILIVLIGIGLNRVFSWMADERRGLGRGHAPARTPPGKSSPGCCRSRRRSASSPARCS